MKISSLNLCFSCRTAKSYSIFPIECSFNSTFIASILLHLQTRFEFTTVHLCNCTLQLNALCKVRHSLSSLALLPFENDHLLLKMVLSVFASFNRVWKLPWTTAASALFRCLQVYLGLVTLIFRYCIALYIFYLLYHSSIPSCYNLKHVHLCPCRHVTCVYIHDCSWTAMNRQWYICRENELR